MSTEAKVGAFVIASLLVLSATTYFVRATQNVRGQVPFTTHLRQAGGMAPGTSVLFGGIRVGQVTAVRPWSEDPTRIEIAFAVRAGTPINANSTARVGSVSLMSSPTLQITTGSNDARRLAPGEAVPSEEAVSLDEITRHVGNLAASANELVVELRHEVPALTNEARTVLANVNAITGPRNQQHIEAILAQLDTVLARESARLAQIGERVSRLAEHADEVVVSARPLVSNADQAVANVNDLVVAIREPLTRDLEELHSTLQKAGTLLGTVENVIGNNEGDLVETMRNLRLTSENVRMLTETLKQRPWNLIRTTQPPDRKVPRR
ncbi:MAG TPA: MlaD family protein [Vicinamibacterales bacterium]|nr:MlaD family protein [Vicinamibacterales bacterium]